MERHFALPVAFAAALHGALLFGFNSSPKAAVAKEPETIIRDFILMPAPDDPEPVVVMAGDAKSTAAPDRPSPVVSPEPQAVTFESDFTIKPPVVEFINRDDMVRVIEIPSGLRKGDGGNPFGGDAIGIISLDNTPRARLQAAPLYPHEAKTQGVSGEVHVEFIVDASGSVVDARVAHSSNRIFEDAAVRAVMKWKFEPGRKHGRVVSFRMVVPVVFNLNE